MCFSATASVTAAATLIPLGAYCVNTARKEVPRWLMLAAYPLAFGIQQAIEGVVWHGINSNNQTLVDTASQGYVFFSHFFWLFWVPFSVYYMENNGIRKRFLGAITILGAMYGLSLFIPLILRDGWLVIELAQHSLLYKTTMIYDGIIDRQIVRGIYALQVFLALVLSSNTRIQVFGIIILISVVGTFVFFKYAFVSVWCFFAAILSVYLLFALRSERRSNTGAEPGVI
jgi:hypothetical protein